MTNCEPMQSQSVASSDCYDMYSVSSPEGLIYLCLYLFVFHYGNLTNELHNTVDGEFGGELIFVGSTQPHKLNPQKFEHNELIN